jgi:hypothetical protein
LVFKKLEKGYPFQYSDKHIHVAIRTFTTVHEVQFTNFKNKSTLVMLTV